MVNDPVQDFGPYDKLREPWMELSTQKRRGARRAGISSKVAKQHIDVRPAVRMILACYAAGVMIRQITRDIWYTFKFRRGTVVVATAVIQKLGGYLYTAPFILS